MTVLRDVFRRRLRSALTISGVAVGVFALVVLGAMAEKSRMTLDESAEYYADKVTIVEKKAGTAYGYNTSRPLSVDKIDEVRSYPGVVDVAAQVTLPLDEENVPFGVPALVAAGFTGTDRYKERWTAAKGRMYEDGEREVAVVGPDLVKRLNASVGSRVTIRGQEFEVVGITTRSNTLIDQAVLVPLADGQALLAKALPRPFLESVESSTLAVQATAYVQPGRDADALASLLNRDIEGIQATGPAQLEKQLGQLVDLLGAILVSVASIALVIGCLSVVNTMLMAVSERRREVGLKRALGASRWAVARDILLESALIGALGGSIALAAGWVAVAVINAVSSAGEGTALFLVTGRLALGSIVFAVVMGSVAGLYPAWRCTRLDPVSALASR